VIRKGLQTAVYYKITMVFNEENALCITLLIDLEEENTPRLQSLIHNLWIIVWIFALIYCKSGIICLLL
jgi:hypothetical protein